MDCIINFQLHALLERAWLYKCYVICIRLPKFYLYGNLLHPNITNILKTDYIINDKIIAPNSTKAYRTDTSVIGTTCF